MMSDQPKQHLPAPPASAPVGGGYQPPPPDPRGDAEAVAALMGMTQATSNDLSENVVGEGTNSGLRRQFDAHTALKKHMTEVGQIPPAGVAPQQAVQPVLPVQPVPPTPQQYQQAAQGYAQHFPPPQMDDGQILRRLLAIEDKLDSLMVLEENIIKQLSRKSAKQLTIRFNDSEDKKSD
ncbi:hypothetical protein H8E06_00475 [bacterium]|nr:hypothetical protein [bacterium]